MQYSDLCVEKCISRYLEANGGRSIPASQRKEFLKTMHTTVPQSLENAPFVNGHTHLSAGWRNKKGEIISVQIDIYTIMMIVMMATYLVVDDKSPQNVIRTTAVGHFLDYVARYNVQRCPRARIKYVTRYFKLAWDGR